MSVDRVEIYKIALELSKQVDGWAKSHPYYWKNKEIDQIQRSSASVPSNISEGYSYKHYPKKYVFFLCIALGSSDETQNHLKILKNRGFLDYDKFKFLLYKYKDLSIRILNLIQFIKKESELDYTKLYRPFKSRVNWKSIGK